MIVLNPSKIEELYSFPAIRCRRIVRGTGKLLDDVQLDGETAFELGTENIGVLAGECPRAADLAPRFRELSKHDLGGQIVVAPCDQSLFHSYSMMLNPEPKRRKVRDCWTVGCLTFSTLEMLRHLQPEDLCEREVSAVILIDPNCMVYRARGSQGRFARNDRPQHLARFRAAHEIDGWCPPFFLFTDPPAKSLNTNQMLAPFGIESWWFVDGKRLRIGFPPQATRGDDFSA